MRRSLFSLLSVGVVASSLVGQAGAAWNEQVPRLHFAPEHATTINDVLQALNRVQPKSVELYALADTVDEQPGAESSAKPAAPSPYWLGIALAPVDGALKAQLNREHAGVLVVQVVANSAAAKAGVQEFDLILHVNEQPMQTPEDLTRAVNDSDGKALTLDLLRAGKPLEIKVTPEKRPTAAPIADPGAQRAIQGGLKWLMQHPEQMDGRMGFVIHPGYVLPKSELPNDMSITFEKTGAAAARITVKRGDKAWTVTEETLNELPPNIRADVEMVLRRPQGITLLPGQTEPAPAPLPGANLDLPSGAPAQDAILEQLKLMTAQIKALQEQVNELRKQN